MDVPKKEDGAPDTGPDAGGNKPPATVTPDSPEFKEAVSKAIDEALADIKSKLDSAYSQRDALAKKVAEREQADRAAELERLEKEGKLKEAYELRLAESNGKTAMLESRVVELTRDVDVRDALSSYAFRNELAADMARRAIVEQLVRGEDGVWRHKSGISIRDFVATYASGEEQSFLFKPKVNQGAGTVTTPSTPSGSSKTSLFEMTQAEVLAKAAKGELGTTRRI